MIAREKAAKPDLAKAPAVPASVHTEMRTPVGGGDPVRHLIIAIPETVGAEYMKETQPDKETGKGGGALFLSVRPEWTSTALLSFDYHDGGENVVKRITGSGRGNAINLYLG